MVNRSELSRREREIMDILYSVEEASVKQIQAKLLDPPTDMAVRRMLHILDEKGLLKRRKNGREVIYSPRKSKKRAGMSALKHVLDTFFDGSVDKALAAHLASKEAVSNEQLSRLQELIEKAREEGQ